MHVMLIITQRLNKIMKKR